MGDFTIHFEKRRRRSDRTQKALNYQIEHVVDEFGMDLMVLADHNGLVVAAAGDRRAAKVFAVYAESLEKGGEPDPALKAVMPELSADRIVCKSITLDDFPLYLCAVMDTDEETMAGFDRARTGLQRIYYTTGEFIDESYGVD